MGCMPSKRHQDIYKIGQKIMNEPEVKALFKNPSDLVYKKYHQMFGFKPSEWKAFQPTGSDVRKFKGELKKVLKYIKKGKIAGSFARNMYTTSGVVRRNPILGQMYDNFLNVGHTMRGRQIIADNHFRKLIRYLYYTFIFNILIYK